MLDFPESAPVDVFAGGRSLVKSENSKASLVFRNSKEAIRILKARDPFVLAEAFVQGQMDIDGDIYEAIGIKEYFYPDHITFADKSKIVFNVLKSYRTHNRNDDRSFISHHYDHSDRFFRLFLGPSMVYSCAYFANDTDTLDEAQDRKMDHLLGKLRLQSGERLLDVGCGWGSLVIKAARDYDAQALGITLSQSQHAFAQARIKELGIGDKCRVELIDYRDVSTKEPFDKIVSVGMYEHVGGKNLNSYFKGLHNVLRDEGIFVNHGITRKPYADWRKASEARFIDKYIFPGGELHPGNRVVEGMEVAGFEVTDVESLRKHYAKTLRHWVSNLQNHAAEARRIVPEQVFRAWVLYMAGCALTFEEGYFNVHQMCAFKTSPYGGHDIPMTRAYLY